MITLDGDNIEVVDRFSYLGDVISTERGAQEAVTSRIRSAWKKFKEVSNAICGRSISLKVRGTLYKSYVRNALTYDAECWALKMEEERRLKTTEMRMLRMISGTIYSLYYSFLPILHFIVNSLLTPSLKQSIITPVLKKSNLNANTYKSFRPVSNLSFISKLIENAFTIS